MASLRSRLSQLPSLRRTAGESVARQLQPRLPGPPSPLSEHPLGAVHRNHWGEHVVAERSFPLPASSSAVWLATLADSNPCAAALLARAENPPQFPRPQAWAFLDLETTGLAGGTGTYAFLVGVGVLEDGYFRLRQFFMRDFDEERSLLTALADFLRPFRVLVTYNGKLFDVPILETRFALARIAPFLDRLHHIDLLYPARRLWRLRWGSARLADLERFVLGEERIGDVPSQLIPRLYFDYLRRRDPARLRSVFDHNAKDLLALGALAARILKGLEPSATGSSVDQPDPLELFGWSRLLEGAGRDARARELCRQALDHGLPAEIEPLALRQLARLSKRARLYGEAVPLWQRLARWEEEAPRACEELAICFEHRLGNLAAAEDAVRRALEMLRQRGRGSDEPRRRHAWLVRFEHRLARLERKRRDLFPL